MSQIATLMIDSPFKLFSRPRSPIDRRLSLPRRSPDALSRGAHSDSELSGAFAKRREGSNKKSSVTRHGRERRYRTRYSDIVSEDELECFRRPNTRRGSRSEKECGALRMRVISNPRSAMAVYAVSPMSSRSRSRTPCKNYKNMDVDKIVDIPSPPNFNVPMGSAINGNILAVPTTYSGDNLKLVQQSLLSNFTTNPFLLNCNADAQTSHGTASTSNRTASTILSSSASGSPYNSGTYELNPYDRNINNFQIDDWDI